MGAVTKEEETEIVQVEDIKVPPNTVKPSPSGISIPNCVQNWASLENVEYVEVNEEESTNPKIHGICWGMLFVYKDGTSSCVGQRRVGFKTKVTRYDKPTHIYNQIRAEIAALIDLKNIAGARFFFTGEDENTESYLEFLEGWRAMGNKSYEFGEQDLMSKEIKEVKGKLR